jgi:hypothetical protein
VDRRRESVEDERDRFFHKIVNALGEVLDHELQHQSQMPMNKSTGRLNAKERKTCWSSVDTSDYNGKKTEESSAEMHC